MIDSAVVVMWCAATLIERRCSRAELCASSPTGLRMGVRSVLGRDRCRKDGSCAGRGQHGRLMFSLCDGCVRGSATGTF